MFGISGENTAIPLSRGAVILGAIVPVPVESCQPEVDIISVNA